MGLQRHAAQHEVAVQFLRNVFAPDDQMRVRQHGAAALEKPRIINR
jgi:hypothetical protein